MEQSGSVTRRKFMANSALAATAIGMTARSYAVTKGANERLRFAFIGCGGIAEHHRDTLLPILEEENAEIVAVCDVYERRAREFQRKIGAEHPKPDLYADYREVLDRKDIDYVLIATPEHAHAYITLDALDAGKHVYVEKPLTHVIEDAQAVVKKVRETGLQLQVGVQGMADDSYSSAHEAIKAGKIGTVVEAQIDYVRNYDLDKGPWRKGAKGDKPLPGDLNWEAWQKPAPAHAWDPARYYEWRCYRDYSGGIATDLFIHRLTRILKACGLTYPERVVGMGGIYTWNDGRDLPDSFEMMCEYGPHEGVTNGMTVHVLGTMANAHGNDHCIRGTSGTLFFREPGWEIVDSKTNEVTETHTKTGGEDVDPHHRNHHAAIREGVALNCPVELGLYGVVACRMSNLSWFDKKAYVWDKDQGTARPA